MTIPTFLARLAAALCGAAFVAAAQTPCDQLKTLSLSGVTFTAVETVAAGPYHPPARAGQPAPPVMLPAYCRVAATLRPSSDSDIRMEVWMPAENWNGKFQMVGNGGWAGVISFPAMAAALREGYATASTD
ncbi:MAG TPA: tannase/feruloyl esterase family alpha/beta hydrolase, partial [Bryobacteraceae bacterium]|nr:tannase/feruloyl esterase family alpha/beta hydrolase [Bryobacteraceae bacterium]